MWESGPQPLAPGTQTLAPGRLPPLGFRSLPPGPCATRDPVPCILRRWKRGEPRKLLRMELRRLLQAAPPTPPPGLGGGVVPGVPVGLARGVCRGECKGVPPEERGEPGGPGRGVERALGGGGCSPAPPPLGPREGSVCVLEVGEPPPRASSPAPGSGEKEKTGLCEGEEEGEAGLQLPVGSKRPTHTDSGRRARCMLDLVVLLSLPPLNVREARIFPVMFTAAKPAVTGAQ